jgi:hypothetical protein
MRNIKIGDEVYTINDSIETKNDLFEKLVHWMEEENHYAAHCGEAIMQDDNCLIDSSELVAEMIDEILKPKHNDSSDCN